MLRRAQRAFKGQGRVDADGEDQDKEDTAGEAGLGESTAVALAMLAVEMEEGGGLDWSGERKRRRTRG